MAGIGADWPGKERRGEAGNGTAVKARTGEERRGKGRLGKARKGSNGESC